MKGENINSPFPVFHSNVHSVCSLCDGSSPCPTGAPRSEPVAHQFVGLLCSLHDPEHVTRQGNTGKLNTSENYVLITVMLSVNVILTREEGHFAAVPHWSSDCASASGPQSAAAAARSHWSGERLVWRLFATNCSLKQKQQQHIFS